MAIFDKEAKAYESWYKTLEGDYVLKKESELLLKMIGDTANKSILDIGCGTGVHSILVSSINNKVIGIDCSKKMILEANKKASDNLSFLEMDSTNLEFVDEQFDIVMSLAMIEFVEGKERVIEEAMRVLKPGGMLLVGTIQKHSEFANMYESQYFQENTVFKYASFMSREELESFFNEFHVRTEECLFNSYDKIKHLNNVDTKSDDTQIGGFMISLWMKGDRKYE
ncbi:class I SAM-dependent methyltransferase [Mycoplasmatota bacterium WC44]